MQWHAWAKGNTKNAPFIARLATILTGPPPPPAAAPRAAGRWGSRSWQCTRPPPPRKTPRCAPGRAPQSRRCRLQSAEQKPNRGRAATQTRWGIAQPCIAPVAAIAQQQSTMLLPAELQNKLLGCAPCCSPCCPRSISICVMARISALSTSSPARSFCGRRGSNHACACVCECMCTQRPGSALRRLHSRTAVAGKAAPNGHCPEARRRQHVRQYFQQAAADAPCPITSISMTEAAPGCKERKEQPARLHHVQQHVQQAAADAAVAHHHIAPQVQPQLMHCGLVLWETTGRAGRFMGG